MIQSMSLPGSKKLLTCLPFCNILINIINNIIHTGGMQRIKTGIQIIPDRIPGKQRCHLTTCQILCRFLILCTANHESSLRTHILPPTSSRSSIYHDSINFHKKSPPVGSHLPTWWLKLIPKY